jgi:hypothetical protein
VQLPLNLWPLTAASADLAWLPRDDGEAPAFVQHAASEGLLPLLFDAAPPELAAALAGWRAMDAANRHRTRTIARMLESLPNLIGEEYALIKGSDYAYRLYVSPELRPQVDIDVLIPRERIDAVTARLAERGYKPFVLLPTHASPRWPDRSFDLGEITLEVHHSIVQRSRARIDYAGLWGRRVPFRSTTRLSDADALLVSVLNIAKDDLATTLLRYLDLWLMLQADPALFAAAAERARDWRIANAFHLVMRVLAAMFPDLALPLPRRPILDRFVDPARAAVRRHRKRNVTRRELLSRKFWLIDGIGRRVVFALDNAAMRL